jgi:hypothetical protein
MGVFDFLFDEVHDKQPAAPAAPTPARHNSPSFNVVLDNTESARTASWGQDGLDLRGVKQRFAANASTGGTVLDRTQFVGSFTATVTAQTDELLSLRFTQCDKALAKRLAAGPSPAKKPR